MNRITDWKDNIVINQKRFDDLAESAAEASGLEGDIISTGWVVDGHPFCEKFFDETARYFCETLNLKSTDEVLEVGCNAGLLLKKLKPFVAKVTGTDIAPECLKRVKDPEISTFIAEAHKQPFSSQSFNAVICQGVYQVFPDLDYAEAVTKELIRLVKPGGCVLVGSIYNTMMKELIENPGADPRLTKELPLAIRNVLAVSYRKLYELVMRPAPPPIKHRLMVPPSLFQKLGKEYGYQVSFPLQVSEGEEAKVLMYRFSALIKIPA